MAGVNDGVRLPLTLLDVGALLRTPPPPVDWLVAGALARGLLTMLAGREKLGKSLLALSWAVCMANGGGSIAGTQCQPGKVLIVDGENSQREIHRRLHAIGLHKAAADRLIVAEARGFDLLNAAHRGLLAGLIAEHKPDAVALDSFRSLWSGRENETDQTAPALDPIRQMLHDHGTAGLLLHHASKAGDSYRGATSIGASVENILLLSRQDGDPDRGRRKLANPACRFAVEYDDRWLSLVAGDDSIDIAAAEPFTDPATTPVAQTLGAAIVELYRRNPDVACSIADLARGLGRGPGDSSVSRAVKRLAGDNMLRLNDRRLWEPTEAARGEWGFAHRNGDGS